MKSYWLTAGLILATGLLYVCEADAQEGRGRGRMLDLFISPAGEPFRAEGPGDPFRRWFDQADANHDGLLSPEEFEADHMRFFAIVDLDKDGTLTPPEVRNYEENIAPEILTANDRPDLQSRQPEEPGDISRIPQSRGGGGGPGADGPPGGGPGGRGGRGRRGEGGPPRSSGQGGFVEGNRQGAGRFGLLNEPQPLRSADMDYNFRITRAEWIAVAARRFGQLDTNHDGKIAFSELKPPRPERGR